MAAHIDVASLPRVAVTSTMLSRAASFERMFPAIHAQVNHSFVYLDGYVEPPAFLVGLPNVTIRHAERTGNLHASSRFLALRAIAQQAVVVSVDDDIVYPPDYVARLAAELQAQGGRCVVGVHGRIFLPPHKSYLADALTMHFARANQHAGHAHELGTGTCAFVSTVLDVDPRRWPRNDMDDIFLAIEAQQRGLPRIMLAREQGWLTPIAENQPDSLWARTEKDCTEQTRLMQVLFSIYARPAMRPPNVEPGK